MQFFGLFERFALLIRRRYLLLALHDDVIDVAGDVEQLVSVNHFRVAGRRREHPSLRNFLEATRRLARIEF